MMQDQEQLDVVVRLHDAQRLAELKRAVFSLVGQTYRPLHINLCVQRFTRGMILDVSDALAPLMSIAGAPSLDILNLDAPPGTDARSALANLGLEAAAGRYLAFLDYDDTLYPEAYALLTRAIRASGAVIAFAGVAAKRVDIEDDTFYVYAKERIWPGRSLIEQFEDNSCPLHSFVIDRPRLPAGLRFETSMTRLEDYDFLLRVCASCRSDFSLIHTIVGDYYFKSDGSNSTPVGAAVSAANLEEWERARTMIAQRRRTTIVMPEVQTDLGLRTPIPGLTIQGVLDRLGRGARRAA